jgi:hypothetical protein
MTNRELREEELREEEEFLKYHNSKKEFWTDKGYWTFICTEERLSEDFMRKNQDRLDWDAIQRYQTLSEDFIRDFQDKICIWELTDYEFSDAFIREFHDRITFHWQDSLSDEIIREFHDEINWSGISEYHTLSEEIIREFKDKVDWYYISKNKERNNLSKKFIKEFKGRINIATKEHKEMEAAWDKYVEDFSQGGSLHYN